MNALLMRMTFYNTANVLHCRDFFLIKDGENIM